MTEAVTSLTLEAFESAAENVLDKKTEPLEAFAVFGVAFRPVFPPDDVRLNFTKKTNLSTVPEGNLPSNVAGIVDVSLTQLATVNVFSSNNASRLNVFASRDGLNCSKSSRFGNCNDDDSSPFLFQSFYNQL